MKIHFVYPRWARLLESRPELKEEIAAYDLGSFRMASLGLPAAAACLPPEVELSFVDQNLEAVDFDTPADLVALGYFTPQATEAHALADEFRARGRLVIAGGIHPTMAPEDALGHVDAVVEGEVEGLWPRILADRRAGQLRPRYRLAELPSELRLPPPRRDLFDRSSYLRTGVVQVARGCPFACPYCVVPGCYGHAFRFRPVADVVADVAALPYPTYFVADENLLFADATNVAYAKALLAALRDAEERRSCFVATYPHRLAAADPAVLALLGAARCRQLYLIFGLEAPLVDELAVPGVLERLAELRGGGIRVMASFTLGHDGDGPATEELILRWCEQAEVNLAEFVITTPYPGTPQFAAMAAEDRLLTREWARYNGANVVFRPRHFGVEELLDLYIRLWQRFYRDLSRTEVLRRYARGFSRSILERPSDEG